MYFKGISSESVECIHLAVDMDERSYVSASQGLISVDLGTCNVLAQWDTLVLKKGVEYLSCAASVDYTDGT